MHDVVTERSVDLSINAWRVLGFPDGDDGWVLSPERAQALDVDAFSALARARTLALNAILGAAVQAGYGVQRTAVGEWLLCGRYSSTSLSVGFVLTFWLQRETWMQAARRYLDGFGEFSDAQLAALAERDWWPEAKSLFAEHQVRFGWLDEYVETDADQTVRGDRCMLSGQRMSACWRQQLSTCMLPEHEVGLVSQQFARVIADTRGKLVRGKGLSLLLDELWLHRTDTWCTKEECMSWADKLDDKRVLYAGNAPWLWSNHKRRTALIECYLNLVNDERTGHGADLAHETMAGALDDVRIANALLAPAHPTTDQAAFARAGYTDALYAAFVQIHQTLHQAQPGDLLQRLDRIDGFILDAGWQALQALMDEPTRAAADALCQQALSEDCESRMAAAIRSIWRLALTCHLVEVIARILVEPRLREVVTFSMGGQFTVFADFALTASLLCPGPDLQSLLADASTELSLASNKDRISTDALAVAIAWERCKAIQDSTLRVSQRML